MLCLQLDERGGLRMTTATGAVVVVYVHEIRTGRNGGLPYVRVGVDAPQDVVIERCDRNGVSVVNVKEKPSAPVPTSDRTA